MSSTDIIIIGFVLIAITAFFLQRYNNKITKKMYESQDIIEQTKQVTQIFVIDKKKAKPTPDNVGKMVYEQMDKMAKRRKLCLVRAKIGPKFITFISDETIFDAFQPKKNYKVEVAGLYIVNIVGMNPADRKKRSWKDKAMGFLRGDKKSK